MTTPAAADSSLTRDPAEADEEFVYAWDRSLSRGSRAALVVVAAALAAGFALAATLDPDPRGFGTHQQLGLPPCSLQLIWGVPCPSCGGTTAFANFVRGDWIAAAKANLSAFGLAVVAAMMIPWCLYSAAIGRTWRVSQPELVAVWILGLFLAVAMTQWLMRLAVELWF